ncbi:helix-turn-helix transcriptional regulator [Tolypothrix sp. VBCCA 56010]|uniref:helix-turn-helix transcriptional regulator n=1 Tax=Tolypothrix sp. VBCCA 56010 TaxID=3137731 RepID=UPI003D7C654B
MTIILSLDNWDELWCQQNQNPQNHSILLDEFETLQELPKCLGLGYCRGMKLAPGVELEICDYEFHHDVAMKSPVHNHLVQFIIFASGFIYCDEVHPNLGGKSFYLSGSGISPAHTAKYKKLERMTCINVEIEPEVLAGFLPRQTKRMTPNLKLLIKENEWKTSFYPDVTLAMQVTMQQILNSPYQGAIRRLYLQAKVFELLAMQLDLIWADGGQISSSVPLKPDTIARIHHARDILHQRLNNPLSMMELAQLVGLNERKLQRGFRELFGTTVFAYLHHHRMEQAQILLRYRDMQVSEIAHAVGYCHLGHFTEAFKRKFGITPKQCQLGKKSP